MRHYFRSPDVFGSSFSFLWNDDLWYLADKQSVAVRLTSGLGIVTNSKFSPDGRYIAFRVQTGEDGSSSDIYSISIPEGVIRRITYLCGKSTSRRMYTDIAGWTPDNQIVISTDVYSPFGAITELYKVSPMGGFMSKLPYGPATQIFFIEDEIVLGRHTNDMPHWKRYRGGTSGVIWKGSESEPFKKIVDLKQHLSSLFYMDKRIYFISDVDGTGNIYSVDANGMDMKKHTNFDKYYVRNAKSDGNRCVFQMGGEIYMFDPKDNESKKIEVNLISSPSNIEDMFPEVSGHLEQFNTDRKGDNISMTVRGRAFIAPFRSGMVLETGTSGERIRFPIKIDDSRMVYVSDRAGEEDVYIKDLSDMTEIRIPFSNGIIEWFSPNEKGDKFLISNNRGELFYAKLGEDRRHSLRVVDRSDAGVISSPGWSPDGKSAVYSFPVKMHSLGSGPSNIIRLYSEDNEKVISLTEQGSYDFSPVFSKDGKYIFFLSNRNLDPTPDNLLFDLSFQITCVPMVIPLGVEASSSFDNLPGPGMDNGGNDRFPLEQLSEKVRPLGVNPSIYGKIDTCSKGILLLEFPVEGMSKYYLFSKSERSGKLIEFKMSNKSTEALSDGVSDFVVSGDGSVIFIRDKDSNLKKIKIDSSGCDESKKESESKFEWGRLKLKVNPREEWKQMYRETKRLVMENYWSEKKLKERYADAFTKYDSFLDSVSTRFELSDILREFQGEFETSHSYEIGGELTKKKAIPVGRLGIDTELKDGKYVVKHILRANLSNEGEKSPAFLATVPLREGDVIVSVNSIAPGRDRTIEECLLNKTDEFVTVQVERDGKLLTSYIKTMSDDRHLRYREWVEKNRETVRKRTDNRVGYVHIPDMGYAGFSEFARQYPIESRKDALIVDVRYNGGGNVSQLILEKLAKRRIGYDIPRRGETEPYPAYSVNGPMVALADENAGSDGDIFTHSFKLFGLGPVVGTRTWGGVIGINPERTLVDGTIVTQPEFAFWFKDVGFGVENYGTDPNIEIQNTPDDWKNGRDSQLEKGIEIALDLLSKYDRKVDIVE